MSSNILDTRDLAKRLEELKGFKETLEELRDQRKNLEDQPSTKQEELDEIQQQIEDALMDFGEAESEELSELESLESEVPEWRQGEALIADHYFRQYAEELADDIGAINRDAGWPLTCIDWEEAADQLKADYSSATYQGTEYWFRNC